MSDLYKVDLQSNAKIAYTNVSAMASTTTPYVSVTVRGDTLNTFGSLTGTQKTALWVLGSSDLSSLKMALLYYAGLGTPFWTVLNSDGGTLTFLTSFNSGTDIGSFNASTYYEVQLIQDNANVGVPVTLRVYDGASLVSEWWNSSTTPTIGTSSGTGCLNVGNVGTIGSYTMIGQEFVVASCKMGTTSGFSDFDSPLEEGSGSSVSPSGTISGTYSWLGSSPFFDEDSFTGLPATFFPPMQAPNAVTVFG